MLNVGLIGGPERPLSDLGLLGYFHYWKSVLICLFYENPNLSMSLEEISTCTAFRPSDILYTLEKLDFLRYWRASPIPAPTALAIADPVASVTNNGARKLSHHSKGGFFVPYQQVLNVVESDFAKKPGRKDRFKRMFKPDCFVSNGVQVE